MNHTRMTVVQCWDDGVTTDVPLMEVLRRHGAKATFNLNAGLHETQRKFGWMYEGAEVSRLALGELRSAYEGFTIANHALTHPFLDRIPLADAKREIHEGRERLQQIFQAPVSGFAYPFGTYNVAVMDLLREEGHVYARTVEMVERAYPPKDAMAFHPNCHFLASDFWDRYEAARACGVFYFWGHSYEIMNDTMWQAFDAQIARISADTSAAWGELCDLFSIR